MIRYLAGDGLDEPSGSPRPPTARVTRPNTYWHSEPPDWFTRWPGEALWITRLACSANWRCHPARGSG